MPTISLPTLTAAPVSAEERLGYVRRHLAQAYPGAPVELVGYAGSGLPVQVAALEAGFFDSTRPYPSAPNWREWAGQPVPFFFDDPAAPLLTLTTGRAAIGADLLAAAFYLLSGWQEYFSDERDQHGRFPYAASVQRQYGFVALPVVNYYFDVLRVALEHVSGQPLQPHRWGRQQAEFAAFISHDVDNLHSGWKAPAKAALRQGRPLRFGRLLGRRLTRPDPWDNLEAVAAQVAQYGGRSTFFLLPEHRKAKDGTPNADYRLTQQLHRRLRKLETQGCEIGLHGQIGSHLFSGVLTIDVYDKMSAFDFVGCRFHYLGWEPRLTPASINSPLAKIDHPFAYDSTLGFAEHYGFRHSYCLPFYPFDFWAGQAADFLEIPLNVMDATLHHPRYLQLAPHEILPALAPVFAEIRRFGGVASVLWHNENFDPANVRNGPREFHTLMQYLQQAGAAFLTGREIWESYV